MNNLHELYKISEELITPLQASVVFLSGKHLHDAMRAADELAALNARVEELETRNREWLESYDITMPCGHKNRYLLTNGRGELVKDYRGDCVCVMCQLEKADEIEAALKGAE